MNYRRSSARALSLPFLVNWLIGDVTNLAGGLLTSQLPTQIYTAAYFVFIDCCMVSQFAYYAIRDRLRRRRRRAAAAAGDSTGPERSAGGDRGGADRSGSEESGAERGDA